MGTFLKWMNILAARNARNPFFIFHFLIEWPMATDQTINLARSLFFCSIILRSLLIFRPVQHENNQMLVARLKIIEILSDSFDIYVNLWEFVWMTGKNVVLLKDFWIKNLFKKDHPFGVEWIYRISIVKLLHRDHSLIFVEMIFKMKWKSSCSKWNLHKQFFR